MKTEYYLLNPAGNITALVTTPAAVADYPQICAAIMQKHPTVEQVGFADLSGETPYLRMSGGEFCGNATLCTAVLFYHLRGAREEIPVTVYGAEKPLFTRICDTADGFCGQILLPKPAAIIEKRVCADGTAYTFPMAVFDGIAHLIAAYDFDKTVAEKLIKQVARQENRAAVGMLFWDEKTGRMQPLVYVKSVDTCILENACASGSCAVCAYLTQDTAIEKTLDLTQPGGVLTVSSAAGQDFVQLRETITILGQDTMG